MKEFNSKHFGKEIRKARLAKGLNQIQFGEKVEISNKTVHNIETGRCLPSLPVYFRICRVLEFVYVQQQRRVTV